MSQRLRYKIIVKTLQNNILTFKVEDFTEEKGFIRFLDLKTFKEKMFAKENVEINPIGDQDGY